MGGWTKIMIIYRWKVPDTVGAYRIRPPHTNLNYYHLLIKETPRFSNSHPYNFRIQTHSVGEIFVEFGCLKRRTHRVGEIFSIIPHYGLKKMKNRFFAPL